MAKQQQFTVEQYQEAKVKAKELGINSVGKTKQTLVDLVNAKLKEQNISTPKVTKAKWFANGYGFTPGDKIVITAKYIEKNGVVKEILQGREAIIDGPSFNEGFVKARLIEPTTGELLNCPISLDIKLINLVNVLQTT